MRNLQFLVVTAVTFLLFAQCVSDSKKKSQKEEEIDKIIEVDENLMQNLNSAKKVFYALPSPIETAMLIKRAGTEFDTDLLNPVQQADKYTTNKSKALNFGVYGADLSYANLFSQTQKTIDYMATSKKLADDLGMSSFIDSEIVKRLETNINNRDSSMAIITEGFMSSSSFLKDAGRPETAALIIAGGWIEGLYIATSLAKRSPNNNELVDRIIDQKMSLVTLLSLLEDYQNNADVASVLHDVNKIKAVYDKVKVVTSKVEPVTNSDQKVTTLQAKTEIFVSDEVFNELCKTVNEVRFKIVSN